MIFSLTQGLLIIVIFQLILIALFLFTHDKGKKISNILLGTFFLSIALNLLDSFLLIEKIYLYNTALVAWGSCLPLLFGPLLYLYTRSVLIKDFRMTSRAWMHFVPFLLVFVLTETGYLLLDRDAKLEMIQNLVSRKIPPYVYFVSALIFLQFFFYAGASLHLISKYKSLVSQRYSDEHRNNISWLSSTIIFFTICMVISAFSGFVGLTSLAQYYYLILVIIIFGVFVFINRVLLKALRRPEIFAWMEHDEKPLALASTKYSGSGLNEGDKDKILNQLKNYFEKEKPYLDPELSLDQLAGFLEIRPKILSQVINESLHKNFFEFINWYRIEEAKKKLINPVDKKVTVLEILYEVGFNSKSSFNTIFKKHTGLTPSEFKKKNNS
ncbi:MAG: hypothetical protein C5B52_16400 [Bacteroidetes bacterium]|nr:MAG: hypothetical protein C5B52_16400 [Bacteroidota bacterium]